MPTIARRVKDLISRFGSLRLRVVAAFVILLSLTLAVAGTQIYVSTKNRLVEELDLDLSLTASQALLHLRQDGGRYVFQGGAVQLLTYPGESDLAISILSPTNTKWDHAGADLPAALPLSTEGYTKNISEQDWRTLAQPILGPGGRGRGLGPGGAVAEADRRCTLRARRRALHHPTAGGL